MIIGTLFGFAIGTAMSDRQRTTMALRFAETARQRTQPIGDALQANASKVADAATDAVTDQIDAVGDTAADAARTS